MFEGRVKKNNMQGGWLMFGKYFFKAVNCSSKRFRINAGDRSGEKKIFHPEESQAMAIELQRPVTGKKNGGVKERQKEARSSQALSIENGNVLSQPFKAFQYFLVVANAAGCRQIKQVDRKINQAPEGNVAAVEMTDLQK